jgi:hypothetical protein
MNMTKAPSLTMRKAKRPTTQTGRRALPVAGNTSALCDTNRHKICFSLRCSCACHGATK